MTSQPPQSMSPLSIIGMSGANSEQQQIHVYRPGFTYFKREVTNYSVSKIVQKTGAWLRQILVFMVYCKFSDKLNVWGVRHPILPYGYTPDWKRGGRRAPSKSEFVKKIGHAEGDVAFH